MHKNHHKYALKRRLLAPLLRVGPGASVGILPFWGDGENHIHSSDRLISDSAQNLHLYLSFAQRLLLAEFRGSFRVSGIEPKLATCTTHILPTILSLYLSFSPSFILSLPFPLSPAPVIYIFKQVVWCSCSFWDQTLGAPTECWVHLESLFQEFILGWRLEWGGTNNMKITSGGKWRTENKPFQITQRIWSLFFSTEQNRGWWW